MPQYTGSRVDILEKVSEGWELYKRTAEGGNGTIDLALPKERGEYYREKLRNAGSGSDGFILVGVREELVAIKFAYGHSVAQEALRREIKVLKLIKKKGTTNLEYAKLLHAPDDGAPWMVLEAIPSGLNLYTLADPRDDEDEGEDGNPLSSAFKTLVPVELICHIFLQLYHSLEEIHGLGIRHGDLKALNILIDSPGHSSGWPDTKIVDWGSSETGISTSSWKMFSNDWRGLCEVIFHIARAHNKCKHKESGTAKGHGKDATPQKPVASVAGIKPHVPSTTSPETQPKGASTTKKPSNSSSSTSGPERASTKGAQAKTSSKPSNKSDKSSKGDEKNPSSGKPALSAAVLHSNSARASTSSAASSTSSSGGSETQHDPLWEKEPWRECRPHPPEWNEFVRALKKGRGAELENPKPKESSNETGKANVKWSTQKSLASFIPMAKKCRNGASREMLNYIHKVIQAASDLQGFVDHELRNAVAKYKKEDIVKHTSRGPDNA